MLQAIDVGWRTETARILERVSFSVAPGELVALTGRNGAGKSTLLDVLAGLRTASDGTVVLGGRLLSGWRPAERARLAAHLPQSVRPDVALTVEEFVLMGRYPHADGWFESAGDRAAARATMALCGCEPLRGRQVTTLSGGERQRVLLAACLAQETPLLLFDEPATFLDIDQQLHCFELLRARADTGAACLTVTHDLNLALTFCTRLLVLADRTLVRDLPMTEALDDPEWLGLFSPRLTLTRTPSGQPWVCVR